MDFIKKYKIVLIVVGLLIVGFFLYSTFFVSDKVVEVTSEEVVQNVDTDLIALLATLRGITLNGELFASPVFRGLVDFSQALRPEDTGRDNPFAPLGR